MRLVDEAVDEGALSVVEVSDEGDVPHQTGVVHKVSEELQIIARGWQILLHVTEFLDLDWLCVGRERARGDDDALNE